METESDETKISIRRRDFERMESVTVEVSRKNLIEKFTQ
jgi:hypothetical protein